MRHETRALGTHTWDKLRLGGRKINFADRGGESLEQGFGPWKTLREHTSRGHSGHSVEASPFARMATTGIEAVRGLCSARIPFVPSQKGALPQEKRGEGVGLPLSSAFPIRAWLPLSR